MDHKTNDPIVILMRQIQEQLADITNEITKILEDEETDSGRSQENLEG